MSRYALHMKACMLLGTAAVQSTAAAGSWISLFCLPALADLQRKITLCEQHVRNRAACAQFGNVLVGQHGGIRSLHLLLQSHRNLQ
jgi:hypothetical protein